MLERKFGFLEPRSRSVSEATRTLHERGYVVLPQAFSPQEVDELRVDIEGIFAECPPDPRPSAEAVGEEDVFRYEMLNRSAVCQRAVCNPTVLEVVEPLLGEDCHVIANTAWRNPIGQVGSHGGEGWHIDAGPHVPRPPDTSSFTFFPPPLDFLKGPPHPNPLGQGARAFRR